MIRLVFTYDKEVIIFDIDNKIIVYRDRKWPMGIKFIPKDEDFIRKVKFSRNRISNDMITWMMDANSGKSLAEWEACKDDLEVSEIVKRDARLKGCVFRKSFTGEELATAEKADINGLKSGYVDKIPVNNLSKEEEN
jgi:hypothetical protein